MNADMLLAISLLVSGFLLIAIEILLIPGFGVPGIVGTLFLVGGIAQAWIRLGPMWGAASLVISLVVVLVGAAVFPHTKAAKSLVLSSTPQAGALNVPELQALVGQEGKSLSPLRPTGSAQFGELRVDVVTDGVFIDAQQAIRVTEVRGNQVWVEPRG